MLLANPGEIRALKSWFPGWILFCFSEASVLLVCVLVSRQDARIESLRDAHTTVQDNLKS